MTFVFGALLTILARLFFRSLRFYVATLGRRLPVSLTLSAEKSCFGRLNGVAFTGFLPLDWERFTP